MGILQQGLNQALTGATFLLQQTPGWQEMTKTKQAKESFNQSRKDFNKSREEATNIASNISEEYYSFPEEYQTKKWKERMLKKTDIELKKAKGLEEGMGINLENMKRILRDNPSMLRKVPGILSITVERFNRASKELARIQRELSEQREQQDSFKAKLKAGSQHTTKAKKILSEIQGEKR